MHICCVYKNSDLLEENPKYIGGIINSVSDGLIYNKNYLSNEQKSDIEDILNFNEKTDEDKLWDTFPPFLRGDNLEENFENFLKKAKFQEEMTRTEFGYQSFTNTIDDFYMGLLKNNNKRTPGIRGIIEFSLDDLYPKTIKELENKGYLLTRIS